MSHFFELGESDEEETAEQEKIKMEEEAKEKLDSSSTEVPPVGGATTDGGLATVAKRENRKEEERKPLRNSSVADVMGRIDRLVEKSYSEEAAAQGEGGGEEEEVCETYEEYVEVLRGLLDSYSCSLEIVRREKSSDDEKSEEVKESHCEEKVKRKREEIVQFISKHTFFGIAEELRGPTYLVLIYSANESEDNSGGVRYREAIEEAMVREGSNAFSFSDYVPSSALPPMPPVTGILTGEDETGGARKVLAALTSFYIECFCVKETKRLESITSIATHLFLQLYAPNRQPGVPIVSLYPLLSPGASDCDVLRTFAIVLHQLIASFVPSLLLESSGTCMEWRGLVQYWAPIIHRQIFSRLPSSAPFMPLSSFFTSCSKDAVQTNAIWDRLLLADDMGLPYFFALSLILAKHETLLEVQERLDGDCIKSTVAAASTEEQRWLAALDAELAIAHVDEVHLLFKRAARLQQGTPVSLVEHLLAADAPSRLLASPMAPSNAIEKGIPVFYPGTICMYVTVAEVCSDVFLRSEVPSKDEEDGLGFLLIDCRPAEQFNAGHLPTAVNLDFEWASSHPSEYTGRFEALEAHRGKKKLVVMGSGREEEDRQQVLPVLLQLFQRDFPFVSCLYSGYEGCHRAAAAHSLLLARHSPQKCLVCTPSRASSAGASAQLLGSKFASIWKQTSTAVAAQVNNILEAAEEQQVPRLVKKPTAPVIFPLLDSSNVSSSHLQEWLSSGQYKVFSNRRVVPGDEATMEVQELPGYLLVTPLFLVWLQQSPASSGDAENPKSIRCCFAQKFTLSSVQRITFQKSVPHYVNFDFVTRDEYEPIERLRFYMSDPRPCIAEVQATVAAAARRRKEQEMKRAEQRRKEMEEEAARATPKIGTALHSTAAASTEEVEQMEVE